MDPRTQERVEEWDSRPFNGGFDGLSDLAAADFSGAVSAAGTWLFMLNGRIVGVFDGDIEDFETASGTQYEAPHPSLPLLCTMEERGGETRANYYTNETPLREVDDTLQGGSFTGYVELSENVLSGDYYAVYYGGRRMAAAYIGNAERLLTGDEAFDRAADEVGIYEVVDVEIEVTDVPGTGGAEPDSSGSDRATADENDDDAIDTGAAGSSTVDDTDAEPSADPTTSSIDPIDVSSTDTADATAGDPIEDVTADDSALTGDIDLTGDASGITAPEETEVESEPASSGITEAEPSLDPDPASQADPTASDESVESVDRNGNDEPEGSDETGSSSTTGVETEFSEADATTDAAAGGASDGDSEAIESEPETDEVESPTDPDLAEVEAAAEELDRNISWVEEDDEPDVNAASTFEGGTTDESDAGSTAKPEPESDENDLEEQFEREEEWRETRRIPSIDPDDSDSDADSSGGGNARSAGAEASTGGQSNSRGGRSADSASTASRASGRSGRSQAQRRGRETTQSRTETAEQGNQEQVAALTEKVETLQEQRDALVTKAEELEAERDRLRSENEDLSATVERLQSRIESLETELEQARTRETETGAGVADASAGRGTHLSPQQALSGTNLFVRYASKSQPTLETAHDGAADRSEVASNLRLEHHTQFDSADAVVDGEPYEDYLASTMEYRFVDWLTEMVLYEIRDTGNADGLGDLYDAIPRIDRAELGATISLEDDDTEDVPDQVTFDIVAFDKMGNPLVLATLNDSREPASKALLEDLEEAASAVKANYPSLAAAIAVTSSYFEPGALEVAEQATSGGLLSRGSKLSYVNLSRKEGYHLCLAESRSEGFHMNVPEL